MFFSYTRVVVISWKFDGGIASVERFYRMRNYLGQSPNRQTGGCDATKRSELPSPKRLPSIQKTSARVVTNSRATERLDAFAKKGIYDPDFLDVLNNYVSHIYISEISD